MLVLTADIGEGHDLPARIIKADLEEEVPGAEVEIANGLDGMGKICAAVLRNGSKVTFRWMPWLFDIQYWLITKFAPARWLFHHIGYLIGGRGLLKLIAEHDPDTVISTYPGVTAVLGMLRENRRLDIPVQSAITDLAGLRYWAHPGVDLHYVTHPESIEEVEKLVGPGTVEWVRPPISREFLMPRTRRDAREALELPAHARIVLVSGGGWGVGDLEGAIRSALVGDDTLVVCITGRNEIAREKLEKDFGDNEQVRILGFTEQMSDWMAAADAMIHATAGPDRARGPHPRLPGRLLRLLGRSPARQQRRLRALRPGRGRPLRPRAGVGSAPRHQRAPVARLLLRLAALDRLAGALGAAAGAAAAGLAPAYRAGRRRGRPGRSSRSC